MWSVREPWWSVAEMKPAARYVPYVSFGRDNAAVCTDIHDIPRPCPRRSTDNPGHSTGYRRPSTGFHGHFTGFHEVPGEVTEHGRGPWH